MGLFLRDDEIYHGGGRASGFARYQQLLSERFGRWWKVNLLTLLGCLPLALGIFYAVGTSSLLVLYPCSITGGMIAGPFIAGMYDAVLRGLRDDHLSWRVLGVGLLQFAYAAVLVLFAPWSLLLLPVTGVWYIVFLSQFLIYEQSVYFFPINRAAGQLSCFISRILTDMFHYPRKF